MIVMLGPTATGKTALAARLAAAINGEIISADSRQVYKGMDIGTGKDLQDYVVQGKPVPYHLVDIVEPGYEYNVFEFKRDFLKAYKDIVSRGKMPVLTGGTGLYLEAVLQNYRLEQVPENPELRKKLDALSHEGLIKRLESYGPVHNTTDLVDRNRLIKAIEIRKYYQSHPDDDIEFPVIEALLFGIHFEREIIRKRITERLEKRLKSGMIEEVQNLLSAGINGMNLRASSELFFRSKLRGIYQAFSSAEAEREGGLKPEQLMFYGLEYKYVTAYITGALKYDEMFRLLNTAIHQFAKRQMTWFRRMEKKGMAIHWIDGTKTLDEKLQEIIAIVGK